MCISYIILLSLVGGVLSQSRQQQMSELFKNLSPQLQMQQDETLRKQVQERYSQAMRILCEKNDKLDEFPVVEKAQGNYIDCVNRAVNINNDSQKKMLDPKDENYDPLKATCKVMPTLKSCHRNMTTTMALCGAPGEKEQIMRASTILDGVFDSLCTIDNDKMKHYIDSNGPECITKKKTAIRNCVNETMGLSFNFDDNNITNFNSYDVHNMLIEKNECNQYTYLETCVINALEKCFPGESIYIMESYFDGIRENTPCPKVTRAHAYNSASLTTPPISLGFILIALMLLRSNKP